MTQYAQHAETQARENAVRHKPKGGKCVPDRTAAGAWYAKTSTVRTVKRLRLLARHVATLTLLALLRTRGKQTIQTIQTRQNSARAMRINVSTVVQPCCKVQDGQGLPFV